MQHESGFSLVEMLAALFVLSLGAVSIGEITAQVLASWERTEQDIEDLNRMASLLSEIERSQSQLLIEGGDKEDAPYILTDAGEPLTLAKPRIAKTSECIFDLVGRTCR